MRVVEYRLIVIPMVNYLEKLTPSQELTTSDLLSIIDPHAAADYSLDEWFRIDEEFRKSALAKGYILDSMKYDDEGQHRLPFDTPWVCRRLP